MVWESPNRNYIGVKFEALRREVEQPYTEFHDQLSEAYYKGLIFKHPWLIDWGYKGEFDFGKLKESNKAKALFDELHALQDLKRQEKFHVINKSKPIKDQIPEDKYNLSIAGTGMKEVKISDNVTAKIADITSKIKEENKAGKVSGVK